MLTLILMRHAKSSWTKLGSRDFDRTLNERGERTAPLIGRYIATQGLTPKVIYCSTAVRTRATCDLVLRELDHPPKPLFSRTLYDGGAQSLFGEIAATQGAQSPVMAIGHNPTIHAVALSLCGGGNPDGIEKLNAKYPPGGTAIIDFDDENWSGISGASGTLRTFVIPRDLEKAV